LEGFIKLNFDGASKGNPGVTGFGAVFRDHLGNILLINVGSLGHTTKNVVELWGLTRGLQLVIEHNFTKLAVEGDSLIIINLFGKIVNGADPE
jgi:ribonuclease HI